MAKAKQQTLFGVDTGARDLRPTEHTIDYRDMGIGRGVGAGKVTEDCLACGGVGVFEDHETRPRFVHVEIIGGRRRRVEHACKLTEPQALEYDARRNPAIRAARVRK